MLLATFCMGARQPAVIICSPTLENHVVSMKSLDDLAVTFVLIIHLKSCISTDYSTRTAVDSHSGGKLVVICPDSSRSWLPKWSELT